MQRVSDPQDRQSHSPPVLAEAEFFSTLAACLPVDGISVERTTRLASLPDDKASKAAVHRTLDRLLGQPPPELIAGLETAGEAYDWYEQRRSSGSLVDDGPRLRVRLRPLHDGDIGMLYETSTDPAGGYRWRYRGTTPSIGDFARQLYEGVLAQYVVEGISDSTPYGLVCACNARFENQTVYIAFLRFARARGKGEVLEGMMLFISYLFETWNFRKIYAEVPEFNATGMFDNSSRTVRIEGRLVDHVFHQNRWWDQLIVALWRQDWTNERGRSVP
jgi:RimJ/RimL family protein N-acetyltransferase